MTKVRIAGCESPETEINLCLGARGDHVLLRGIDAHGNDYIIAMIDKGGICLAGGISSDTGWPLDENGCMVVQQ